MQKIIEEIAFSRESAEERALDSLIHLLLREYGFDFSAHKRPSVQRRVRRRMSAVGLSSLAEYREHIGRNPDELPKLFDMLLINVTAFFRDPDAWEALATLLRTSVPREVDRPVRVWSAGCSSGEEAYTLAILLHEWLGGAEFSRRVRIFATDVDDEALQLAHRALYPGKSVASLPPELVERYFTTTGDVVSVKDEIRRAVVVGHHDLVEDPPLQRINVLTCRNALMYFNTEVQARLLQKLHFALDTEGLLMLGKAEMLLLSHSDIFAPADVRMRIFAGAKKRSRSAELVGAREDLATTSQELAATCEELATMNEELSRRSGELHRTGALLTDVLACLPTGVAILDRDLVVALWSERMATLCRRPAREVERRPFAELDVRLPVGEIVTAARRCLQSGEGSVLPIDPRPSRDETIPCVVSVRPLRGALPSGVIVLVEEVA